MTIRTNIAILTAIAAMAAGCSGVMDRRLDDDTDADIPYYVDDADVSGDADNADSGSPGDADVEADAEPVDPIPTSCEPGIFHLQYEDDWIGECNLDIYRDSEGRLYVINDDDSMTRLHIRESDNVYVGEIGSVHGALEPEGYFELLHFDDVSHGTDDLRGEPYTSLHFSNVCNGQDESGEDRESYRTHTENGIIGPGYLGLPRQCEDSDSPACDNIDSSLYYGEDENGEFVRLDSDFDQEFRGTNATIADLVDHCYR